MGMNESEEPRNVVGNEVIQEVVHYHGYVVIEQECIYVNYCAWPPCELRNVLSRMMLRKK